MIEVKLVIDSNQIGETVLELFKNLSEEDKKELAKDVMREWLKAPDEIETTAYEQKLLGEFKNGKRELFMDRYPSSRPKGDLTDGDIKRDMNFVRLMEAFKCSKQRFISEAADDAVIFYKKHLLEAMDKDPRLDEIKTMMEHRLVEEFPEIMFKSLVHAFAENLSTTKNDIQTAIWNNMYMMQNHIQGGLR